MTVRPSSSTPRSAAQASSGARSRVGRRRCGSARAPRSTLARRGQRQPPGAGSAEADDRGGVARRASSGVPSAITRPRAMHDDAVGEVLRLVHVVRGEQDRLAELAQAGDQLPRLAAGGRVEAGGRLVEEDQLGVAGDAEREVQPAALAAGERRPRGASPRSASPTSSSTSSAGARVRVGGAVELDRLAHRDRRVQPVLLQHDADPLAERALALGGVEAEHGRPRRRRPCGGLRGSRRASSCRRRWGRGARAPRRGGPSGPRRRAPCSSP